MHGALSRYIKIVLRLLVAHCVGSLAFAVVGDWYEFVYLRGGTFAELPRYFAQMPIAVPGILVEHFERRTFETLIGGLLAYVVAFYGTWWLFDVPHIMRGERE